MKSNEEWKSLLPEDVYKVTALCGTEPPWTGKYNDLYEPGTYICFRCENELFSSETKFKSGSGWPSYYDVIEEGNILEKEDNSHGMVRTEVVCSNCNAHLGHVFKDGPPPTGLRYCINSVSMKFVPEERKD